MIRDNSNASPHAIVSSRPSHRQRRPVIRTAMRNALPICLSLSIAPAVFQARHADHRLFANSSPSRSSSRSIPSRRASRSYIGLLAHAVFVMPSRRVLLVGSSYSLPLHRPGIEHGIAIAPSASLYISIASLYSYIFISFIYIAYIIFIIYIHQRDMMSNTPIPKQAARRSASRPAVSNRASGTRQERCRREQETGDDEPSGNTDDENGIATSHDGNEGKQTPAPETTRREPPTIRHRRDKTRSRSLPAPRDEQRDDNTRRRAIRARRHATRHEKSNQR